MTIDLPTWADLIEVVTLRQYNTRVVVLSTAMLGVAAGLIGTFLLLRKRSLMGDALSHAMLPGVAMAFIVMVALGGSGKSLPLLLLGAGVFGVIGFASVMLIHNYTRLKDDAAMGIVLSVFFGAGVALLGIVQRQRGRSGVVYLRQDRVDRQSGRPMDRHHRHRRRHFLHRVLQGTEDSLL
jgi:manganese/zinc/iron transport system permease protein